MHFLIDADFPNEPLKKPREENDFARERECGHQIHVRRVVQERVERSECCEQKRLDGKETDVREQLALADHKQLHDEHSGGEQGQEL
jgi:hypothetical protein